MDKKRQKQLDKFIGLYADLKRGTKLGVQEDLEVYTAMMTLNKYFSDVTKSIETNRRKR